MPFGFLCCGPSAENAVYNSSDEDSSSDERETDAAVSVIHWPHVGDNVPGLPSSSGAAVLPSNVKKVAPRRAVSCSRAPPLEESDLMKKMAMGWKGMQASLGSIFSPRPHRRKRPPSRERVLSFTKEDSTALNLAFRETRRLPDVAGEERVAWAAGVLRIDLTETGIRTLRGLDAFPNVQTLVLDSNGLLSLPMDCPWVPSLETLWLCNNEVENLDGLLCQVNDVFPRLKSLALMGNPVWPAAISRARGDAGSDGGETYSSLHESRSAGGKGAAVSDAAEGVAEGEGGAGEGTGDRMAGWEGEEMAYRLHVVRRLPGLVTLDCADVTEKERARAKEGWDDERLIDVTELLLEPEPTTDVEESLPRDTPPGSAKSVTHGVGKLLDDDRERRRTLPTRSALPSTWYKEAVVMDVGSGWTRMGLAGEDKPSCSFPSIVGRIDLKAYDQLLGQDERVFVGHGAVEEAGKRAAQRDLPEGNGPVPSPIMLQHPLSNGVVTDWDDMEELWRYGIVDAMGLDPIEHPVLMADSTATGPGEREKATEILFETLSTPAVHMALQPVLALYACGPSSGLVVDVGESGTQVAPIFDGFVLERGVRQINLGGRDVTRNLGALVNAKVGLMGGEDFDMDDPCDALKLESLKSKVCFVSENVDEDNAKMELRMTKPYTLPDGTRITLGRERYRAAELLFDPAMALREEESLQNSVLDSILACERKTWAILAQTVILTGGTTEMVGLNRRLQRELTRTARASGIKLKFTVMVPEDDHNNTVWVGGSMLASTGALDELWFTRAEYEEYGAGSIHSKFAA